MSLLPVKNKLLSFLIEQILGHGITPSVAQVQFERGEENHLQDYFFLLTNQHYLSLHALFMRTE